MERRAVVVSGQTLRAELLWVAAGVGHEDQGLWAWAPRACLAQHPKSISATPFSTYQTASKGTLIDSRQTAGPPGLGRPGTLDRFGPVPTAHCDDSRGSGRRSLALRKKRGFGLSDNRERRSISRKANGSSIVPSWIRKPAAIPQSWNPSKSLFRIPCRSVFSRRGPVPPCLPP